MPHVSSLFIHPVKSLRGCAVPTAEVDALGFVGDRRFLVVDERGGTLTQRMLPRMARISTALTADDLTLSADGFGNITVPRAADAQAPLRTVSVWRSTGLLAEDCGDAVAAWLRDALALECRLMRIGDQFHRPVLKQAAHSGDVTSFVDGSPILVISEASLADLNDRIQENGSDPVPMNRFRPNLVVRGCAAFAEDEWPSLQIGTVTLRAAGKSDRCILTTTDQLTGARGQEPLKTLATFRRDPHEPGAVFFGANFIHESKHGTVCVGDEVVVP